MSKKSENIGHQFMLQTRHKQISKSDQQKDIPPPAKYWDLEAEKIIELPAPDEFSAPELDLLQTIEKRRSHRNYTSKSLTKKEFSILTYYTQGLKRDLSGGASLRTVPSAGARHAFETFIYIDKGQDLPRGIYHYRPAEHNLALIKSGNFGPEVTRSALGQNHVGEAAAVFFWAADKYRMCWRYSERGYRYLHLDAGHVCQNLYLAAEAINAGVCAIAAFDDEYTNELLDLDGRENFVIYMASVGSKENQDN